MPYVEYSKKGRLKIAPNKVYTFREREGAPCSNDALPG